MIKSLNVRRFELPRITYLIRLRRFIIALVARAPPLPHPTHTPSPTAILCLLCDPFERIYIFNLYPPRRGNNYVYMTPPRINAFSCNFNERSRVGISYQLQMIHILLPFLHRSVKLIVTVLYLSHKITITLLYLLK
jgi:hypothetical protein